MCQRVLLLPVFIAVIGASICPCEIQAVELTSSNTDNPLVVKLNGQAIVNQSVVTIGDIAGIEGGSPWLRERVRGLDVGEVSTVGRTLSVSREQVNYRVQLAGIDPKCIRMEGPAQVLVNMVTVELSIDEIVKAAQRAILERNHVLAKDAEFRLLADLHLPLLNLGPTDQVSLSVDPLPAGVSSGNVRADVAIHVNGQRRAVVTVALEVTVYREALIAARLIEAGEIITVEHLHRVRRPFNAGTTWLPYSEALVGKRALHQIQPGQVLAPPDLDLPAAEDEVLIRTRDNVKLVASIHNLRITATGEALQEGKIGQNIRVRNIDSGKTVVGRVVSRGTIEVEY